VVDRGVQGAGLEEDVEVEEAVVDVEEVEVGDGGEERGDLDGQEKATQDRIVQNRAQRNHTQKRQAQ